MYAEPFDLTNLKLLILHVSGHRDDNMVRPIWNKIFEEGKLSTNSAPIIGPKWDLALDGVEPKVGADRIMSRVVPLGQRFYPSDSAFPLRKSPHFPKLYNP